MHPKPEPASVPPAMQSEPGGANSSSGSEGPGPRLEILNSQPARFHWYHKLASVMAAVFCFELGVFLVIYPWVSEWDVNASIIPVSLRDLWTSPWFRGAISGLGLLNMYISFAEVFRLRRFSA